MRFDPFGLVGHVSSLDQDHSYSCEGGVRLTALQHQLFIGGDEHSFLLGQKH